MDGSRRSNHFLLVCGATTVAAEQVSHRVGLISLAKTPSSEPVLRSRLLPRVSFRFLLTLTAIAAVLSTMARVAGDGGSFARALLFGIALLAAVLLLGAILFLFSWIVATFTLVTSEPQSRPSPFAENQLPPQTLPPRDRVS